MSYRLKDPYTQYAFLGCKKGEATVVRELTSMYRDMSVYDELDPSTWSEAWLVEVGIDKHFVIYDLPSVKVKDSKFAVVYESSRNGEIYQDSVPLSFGTAQQALYYLGHELPNRQRLANNHGRPTLVAHDKNLLELLKEVPNLTVINFQQTSHFSATANLAIHLDVSDVDVLKGVRDVLYLKVCVNGNHFSLTEFSSDTFMTSKRSIQLNSDYASEFILLINIVASYARKFEYENLQDLSKKQRQTRMFR